MNAILRKLVWLIMVVPAVYLAVVWKQVPAMVPLHFDFKGNIDKYGTKHDFLILISSMLLLNAIVYLIVTNIYKIDPRKDAVQNKERMQRIAFGVSVYLSAIFIMVIYQITHSNTTITIKFVFVAVGLLFALIGNNMYNIKPNYFAGIRLPWTLENEDNWRKTHQLAGRLWFFGGILFAIIALLLSSEFISYVGGGLLAILIIVPIVYSYNLYRTQKRLQQ